MGLIAQAAPTLGVRAVCDALDLPRATFYRWRRSFYGPLRKKRVPRALSEEERAEVLGVLHEERFADQAPAEVYATLLDEGRYLCSIATMYRILRANAEVRERRDQLRHPAYAAPELLATRPNTLWSWDITKLLGPEKWTYYQLYMIIDVFSRYIVGWMLAPHESGELARKLIDETCERQGIVPGQLTLHADRGPSMTSKTVAEMLADRGVLKTHSRPYVSDDNPFSEAHFKTLKYQPGFPERFGCLPDARAHVAAFVQWYNEEHHHSALALLTPAEVHFGRAQEQLTERARVLSGAYEAHRERFVHGRPSAGELPSAVWINPPKTPSAAKLAASNEPKVDS